jgi:hypothetical protein
MSFVTKIMVGIGYTVVGGVVALIVAEKLGLLPQD